ncbi:hypothetical protein INR49_020632, partial [Caranx melampygus]
MSLSAGAVNLALLLLTCVGGRSSTCPAVCRCEADGTLQSVDCDGAGLRSVPSNLSSFTSALRLAGNCLSQINGDAFTVLTGLTLLNLQNNQLRTVPSEALKNLKNLRSLRVTQLQALTLDLNAISTVPDRAFASLGQLLVLDLSFNRINRFPSAIRSLSRLRDLNLQNNNILVVPSDAFSGNPSLRTINIRNNRLHTVQLQPEPQHLYVSMVTTHLDSELQDELCCRGTGHEDESLSPGETEDREETEDRKETEDREDSGSKDCYSHSCPVVRLQQHRASDQDQDQDRIQVNRVTCCSLALILVVMVTGPWTRGLALFNAVCLLITVLPCLPRVDAVTLSVLTHTLLSVFSPSSLLCPDVSTCAQLVLSSLSCCVDPLIHLVLSRRPQPPP